MFSKASDAELITAIQGGSADALTEIFSRFWKPLYIQALNKLKSHALAEEVVQDLFADLWEKRDRLFSQEGTNLGAYLHRAVKNKILNHVRKLVYDKKYWDHYKQNLPVAESSVQQTAEFNELQDKLKSAVERLPVKTREIFVLNKLQGVSVMKISEQLNLSEKAVGYHLTKSAKELKVQLRDFIS